MNIDTDIIVNDTQSVNTPDINKINAIYKAIPKDSPLSIRRGNSNYASYGNHLIEDLLPRTAICYTYPQSAKGFEFEKPWIKQLERETEWIEDMRFSNDRPAMACINDDNLIRAVVVRAILNEENMHHGYEDFVSIQSMMRQIHLPWPNIISEITTPSEKMNDFTELVWILDSPVKRDSEEHEQLLWAIKQIEKIIINRYCLKANSSDDMVAWNLVEGVPGIWQYRNRDWAYKWDEFVSKIKTMVYKMGYGDAMGEIRKMCLEELREHPCMEKRTLDAKAQAKAKQVLRENKHIYQDYETAIYGQYMPVIHGKKTDDMLNYQVEIFDSFLFHETEDKTPYRPEAIIMEGEFYKKIMAMTRKVVNEVYAAHLKKNENKRISKKPKVNAKPESTTETKEKKNDYHLGKSLITDQMRKKAGNNRASLHALEESRKMRTEKKKKRMLEAATLKKEGHSISKIAERIGVTPRQVMHWFAEMREADDTGSAQELVVTVETNLEPEPIIKYVELTTCYSMMTAHSRKQREFLSNSNAVTDPLRYYRTFYKEELVHVLARQCARIAKGEDLGVLDERVRKIMVCNIPGDYFLAGENTAIVYYLGKLRREIYQHCFGWLDFAKTCRVQEDGSVGVGIIEVLGCSYSLKETVDELTLLFEKALTRRVAYDFVVKEEKECLEALIQAIRDACGGEFPEFTIMPPFDQKTALCEQSGVNAES